MSEEKTYFRCYSTTCTYFSQLVWATSLEEAVQLYRTDMGIPPALVIINSGFYVLQQDGTYEYTDCPNPL